MKMLIGWHKGCLQNAIKFVERKKEEAARLQDDIARYETENKHYAMQITEAEKQRKSTFDRDLFKKTKKAVPK